jgi:hypothetical protein
VHGEQRLRKQRARCGDDIDLAALDPAYRERLVDGGVRQGPFNIDAGVLATRKALQRNGGDQFEIAE